MTEELIAERSCRHLDTERGISQKWGDESRQVLTHFDDLRFKVINTIHVKDRVDKVEKLTTKFAAMENHQHKGRLRECERTIRGLEEELEEQRAIKKKLQ
ncbi:hypothetical protein Ciccas_004917, partial [Cichlidogyrus casuarinus]